MVYTYKLFDLTLAVPFPCPMLTLAPVDAVPDVSIIEDTVSRSLDKFVVEDQNWQAAPGRFLLFGGSRAGRFLIEDGVRITLQRNPAAEDEHLCANLLSHVIVALLHQRGQLVLHASVVMTPYGAIAISGTSGVGKSTTQAALLEYGCKMVTDDITVLKLDIDGRLKVLPGLPKMHLCLDAATKLGHDLVSLKRNPLRMIKVLVPIDQSNMANEPVELKAMYLLNKHPGDSVIIKKLTGADKFIAQQDCIYGPLFPEEHPGMFSYIRALAEQTAMIRIERPDRGYSVKQVVEAILHG